MNLLRYLHLSDQMIVQEVYSRCDVLCGGDRDDDSYYTYLIYLLDLHLIYYLIDYYLISIFIFIAISRIVNMISNIIYEIEL